jgi:hypothetical protein
LQIASFLGSIGASFAHIADKKIETEKDHVNADDKRVYRRPQLTAFGSVANVTRVNKPGPQVDNEFGGTFGPKIPPGIGS